MAKGAEVITAAALIAKQNEEKSKKQNTTDDLSQTRESKSKRKIESNHEKPGPSGVEPIKKKKHSKKKTKPKDYSSSSTRISDIMSIHSEIEFDYSDFERVADELWNEGDMEQNAEEERTILSNKNLNTPKEKGKGKGKKTKTGKENNCLEEVCDFQKTKKKLVLMILLTTWKILN